MRKIIAGTESEDEMKTSIMASPQIEMIQEEEDTGYESVLKKASRE